MSSSEEWKQHKLDRLTRLKGLSIKLADYTAPSADWDHDHCEGCATKFADFDGHDILHSGYYTIRQIRNEHAEVPEFIKQWQEQGRKVMAKPDAKIWVCKECFEEFRHTLHWSLK